MTKAWRDNRRMNVLQKMAVRGLGYANTLGDASVASPVGSTITTSSYGSSAANKRQKTAAGADDYFSPQDNDNDLDKALRASVLSRQRELITNFRRDGMYHGGRRYEERGVLEQDDIEDDSYSGVGANEAGGDRVGANEVGAFLAINEEEDDNDFINSLTSNMN